MLASTFKGGVRFAGENNIQRFLVSYDFHVEATWQ